MGTLGTQAAYAGCSFGWDVGSASATCSRLRLAMSDAVLSLGRRLAPANSLQHPQTRVGTTPLYAEASLTQHSSNQPARSRRPFAPYLGARSGNR